MGSYVLMCTYSISMSGGSGGGQNVVTEAKRAMNVVVVFESVRSMRGKRANDDLKNVYRGREIWF